MSIWKITPIWQGETVAIFAGGPSMSQQAADANRQHKTIAVNYSYKLAPWADMLIAMDSDPGFFADAEVMGFNGLKICGGAFEIPDVHYIGQRFEKIVLGPNHTIDTRNSGLTALRMAAELGASKIIMCGYDPETRGHWGGYPANGDDTEQFDSQGQSKGAEPYPGMTLGLSAIIAELRAQGIVVERYESPPIEQQAEDKPAKAGFFMPARKNQMSDVKVIRYLLANNAPLVAVIPAARIMAGKLPIGTVLPAISVVHISTGRKKMVSKGPAEFCTSRVQITAQAIGYAQQKSIISLVRSALPRTRGLVNGVLVDNILHELDGPDWSDEELEIYMESVDYKVTYSE